MRGAMRQAGSSMRLRLDLKIALQSVSRVLKRSDISNDGHAMMTPEFMGPQPSVDALPPHG